jgi:hypothetical protein
MQHISISFPSMKGSVASMGPYTGEGAGGAMIDDSSAQPFAPSPKYLLSLLPSTQL